MLFAPNTPQAPRFVDLEFVDVPEVSASRVDSVFHDISSRRAKRLGSFGAFVVRGSDAELVAQSVDALCADYEDEEASLGYKNLKHTSRDELLRDHGKVNDVTVLHATAGSAEVALLVGSYFHTAAAFREAVTDDVFAGTLDTRDLSRPETAFRTTLEEGDVLIFDHSQLYSIRSQADDGRSRAYSIKPSPK